MNTLTPQELERMFSLSHLTILKNVNNELLNQFKQLQLTSDYRILVPASPRSQPKTLGQIFLKLVPFLKNYLNYASQLETSITTIKNKKLKDKQFKSLMKKLEKFCVLQQGISNLFQLMTTPLSRIVYYRDILIGKF